MKAQFALATLVAVASAACGGSPEEPASPPIDAVDLSAFPPGLSPNAARGGALPVSGHLDGQLRGIELAADTTDNAGSFEVWKHGGGRAQLQIATTGTPSGAGMLIVGFMGTALGDLLDNGSWSSDERPADDVAAVTTVTSCAGPAVGEWPYELPAVSADIEATVDPERPSSVVLVVKGQFPAAQLGADATSELVGTYRFERFE